MDKHVVFYCDGSCVPNRGFAGSGVFGYIYSIVEKNKNFKHPFHDKLYFTPDGFSNSRSELNIDVERFIEVIKAINNPASTNNEAELLAVTTALEKCDTIDNLKSVTIITDSSYIVTAFNENMDTWIKNDWKRVDGKPIVHIKEWTIIDNYRNKFKEMGIDLTFKWIKGHNGDYGNDMSDLYSVIGSNTAKQINSSSREYIHVVYDKSFTFNEYKASFNKKDFIFFFRDLYFSSNEQDDTNYCFISSSEDPSILGKKNLSSIFVTNIGYVPDVINKIKAFYRGVKREYVTPCCMKINKLDNRDLYRLIEHIPIESFLVKTSMDRVYSLVGDNTPFLFETGMKFPFAMKAINIFNNTIWLDQYIDDPNPPFNLIKADITNLLYNKQTKKIILTNKDKDIDVSHLVEDRIKLAQRLILTIGYDIPSYLALKNIESNIEQIQLFIKISDEKNYCTAYTYIETKDRTIYSVNIENKYLIYK